MNRCKNCGRFEEEHDQAYCDSVYNGISIASLQMADEVYGDHYGDFDATAAPAAGPDTKSPVDEKAEAELAQERRLLQTVLFHQISISHHRSARYFRMGEGECIVLDAEASERESRLVCDMVGIYNALRQA